MQTRNKGRGEEGRVLQTCSFHWFMSLESLRAFDQIQVQNILIVAVGLWNGQKNISQISQH